MTYFIVLDEAPIRKSRPKYDLMHGDPDTASGFFRASATTMKALLRHVPVGETVYRVYLARTDGKTGKKVIHVQV